ncbi:1918_t:CDS:2, partial [Paraglomus occultum]
ENLPMESNNPSSFDLQPTSEVGYEPPKGKDPVVNSSFGSNIMDHFDHLSAEDVKKYLRKLLQINILGKITI